MLPAPTYGTKTSVRLRKVNIVPLPPSNHISDHMGMWGRRGTNEQGQKGNEKTKHCPKLG